MDWRWRRRTVLRGRSRCRGIVSCCSCLAAELSCFLSSPHGLLVIISEEART